LKKRLLSGLYFIGLIDIHSNCLSLTHIALLLSVLRLLQLSPPTGSEAAVLLFTLWACYFHKVFNKKSEMRVETPLEASVKKIELSIEELESRVSALSIQSGFKRM
jgi:hypothetical protein